MQINRNNKVRESDYLRINWIMQQRVTLQNRKDKVVTYVLCILKITTHFWSTTVHVGTEASVLYAKPSKSSQTGKMMFENIWKVNNEKNKKKNKDKQSAVGPQSVDGSGKNSSYQHTCLLDLKSGFYNTNKTEINADIKVCSVKESI